MSSLVNDVMLEVLGQVEDVRKKALKESVRIVKKDMKERVCDRAVLDYYADYQPTHYKRTYSLFKLFTTYARQDGNTLDAWIEYDSDRLPQYYSNSPRHKSGNTWISRNDDNFDPIGSDNGVPDKEWVFKNFWEGIHPRYYIDSKLSQLVGEIVVYDDSYRFTSTRDRILKYASEYEDRMKEIIVDRMKAQL